MAKVGNRQRKTLVCTVCNEENYRTETNRLIKDITENKYNDSANWTISFDDHTLTIVTNED